MLANQTLGPCASPDFEELRPPRTTCLLGCRSPRCAFSESRHLASRVSWTVRVARLP